MVRLRLRPSGCHRKWRRCLRQRDTWRVSLAATGHTIELRVVTYRTATSCQTPIIDDQTLDILRAVTFTTTASWRPWPTTDVQAGWNPSYLTFYDPQHAETRIVSLKVRRCNAFENLKLRRAYIERTEGNRRKQKQSWNKSETDLNGERSVLIG